MSIVTRRSIAVAASLPLAVLALCSLTTPTGAQNLVQNPGFETGDATGWSLTTTSGSTQISSHVYPGGGPNTGSYYGLFGDAAAAPGSLSQILATVSGQDYVLDYFLANFGTGSQESPNIFSVLVDGNVLSSLTNIPTQPYTEYSFGFTATGPSTNLTFSGGHTPFALFLDDVSVTATESSTPEPGPTALLAGVSLTGLFAVVRLRKARRVA
jgi:hypothetical protein